MSAGRRHYADALDRQPGVSVKVWGPGWPGFDSGLSLAQCIIESGYNADALWLYKPEDIKGLRECEIPKFCCYNECWPHIPGKALEEVNSYGADLVIHHHENDASCFDGFNGKVCHIPHGADKETFWCDTPLSERTVHSILTGVQSPEIYPLRARYANLARSGTIPCVIRNHPGYRLKGLQNCDKQTNQYAYSLKSCKISLCCTSKYRYLLAKIVESMLAGCLVVTDAADDSEFEKIRPFVIEVSHEMSDRELANTINTAIESGSYGQELAEKGRQYAEKHLTTDVYAERLVREIQSIL